MQGKSDICVEAEMNDYISKPIKPESLVKMREKCGPYRMKRSKAKSG